MDNLLGTEKVHHLRLLKIFHTQTPFLQGYFFYECNHLQQSKLDHQNFLIFQLIDEYFDLKQKVTNQKNKLDEISNKFKETRNYVQRVLENYNVYRYVLEQQPIAMKDFFKNNPLF